ncbi:MAG: glycosyltransferase family 2 protein [Treponema sp.]|jgi:GT2 family glycosyltransferase|nr:glycosyltransferase family 2 protein [Treponema sp.]
MNNITIISASVVLYNSDIERIKSIIQSFSPSENRLLYIIDNSTNDRFRILEKQFTDMRYIYSKNIGYGAAHNIALHEAIDAGSAFHLILNPDIRFDPTVIPFLLRYMQDNHDVSYILPKVVYPNGECQYLCKLLPTPFDLIFRRFMPKIEFIQKINDRYVLKKSGYNKVLNPPCLSGCFMFLRMSVIKKHTLFFDERFFMYCEDVDFIRRLHRISKTIYLPDVFITHDHAKASYISKKMLWEHIKSAVKYFNKWGWFFDPERTHMNKQILHEIALLNK